jgi:hypothetical protein
MGIGVFGLAIATVIATAGAFVDENEDDRTEHELRAIILALETELACRFDATQPLEAAQAELEAIGQERGDALALGLAALQADDDAEVARQAERIRALSERTELAQASLAAALRDRSEAVDECEDATPEQ